MLRWARENGCPWEEDIVTANAARGGHLEMLKYARVHGCAWTVHTTAAAARGGHLETLRWAHEHGCEWDEKTVDAAYKSGCPVGWCKLKPVLTEHASSA